MPDILHDFPIAPAETAHHRVSCFCWGMYLRILERWLEHGETVPYARRLEV